MKRLHNSIRAQAFATRILTVVIGVTMGWMAMMSVAQAQTSATANVITTTNTALSIVQACQRFARGADCQLMFVPTQGNQTPAGNIQSQCSAGWLAAVTVEQGTVEQGGVNRGSAMVCGYPTQQAALNALFTACDQQNLGMCSNASRIDAQWGFWSDKSTLLQSVPLNQAVDIRRFEQYDACQSSVPVTQSATCTTGAAQAMRQSGFK